MSNYLNGKKGTVIIHSSQVPTNIVTLTEANASSFSDSNSLQFSPFQNGGMQIDYDSLATEDSGRSVDGYLHITWIISRARKVEMQLPPCSAAFASQILKRVMGKHYYLTYWDILTNAEKTIYVYTSNGRGGMYSGVVRNGIYQGISFNAIEIMGETSE